MSAGLEKGWGRWGVVVLYASGIFYLSHQPQLPAPPGGDKTAHLVVYAGLAFLCAWALQPERRSAAARPWASARLGIAWLIASVYGVTDEWHQSFVPGRDASSADIAADVAGALIGGLAFVTLKLVATQLSQQRCDPSGPVSNSGAVAAARPPKEGS